MDPHGFLESVPNVVVPSCPTTKPGARREKVISTTLRLLVEDFMEKEWPSSARTTSQLSAWKECLDGEKEVWSSWSEHHSGG